MRTNRIFSFLDIVYTIPQMFETLSDAPLKTTAVITLNALLKIAEGFLINQIRHMPRGRNGHNWMSEVPSRKDHGKNLSDKESAGKDK